MEKHDELEPRARPTVSAPTSKVTIAFPFSQIRTQEPSDEVRELARIVVELADRIAEMQPSPELDQLAAQSRALFARLDR
jgi:hypothetical protein